MAFLVDWESGVITVPQADLVFLSAGKYKLDLDEFRRKCRALEWSFDGLSYPPIIAYNSAVDTGDVILARVVLIVNGYTVTFEDGQYAVLFDGANTNIHNNTNVNQVSIRPNNSTGLQDLSTLLASAYGGEVVLDVVNGQSGTVVPIGTLSRPSDNLADALVIMDTISAKQLTLRGDYTLGLGDNMNYRAIGGVNPLLSNLTVLDASDTIGLLATNLSFAGALDGGSILEHCVLGEVQYFSGYVNDCAFTSNTIFIKGIGLFMDTRNGATCISPPILDLLEATGVGVRGHIGDLIVTNKIGTGSCKIELNGELTIDASCTTGTITVYGDGWVTNNGTCTVIDRTTGTVEQIADAVWGQTLATGTTGDLINKIGHIEGKVYVNPDLAEVGDGSQRAPFNVFATALAYAETNNIRTFVLEGDITLPNNFRGYTVYGVGVPTVNTNNKSLSNTKFYQCTLSGIYTESIIGQECVIADGTTLNGFFEKSMLLGSFVCEAGSNVLLANCFNGITGAGTTQVSLNGAGTAKVTVTDFSGNFRVSDCDTATDEITVSMAQGHLTFDASCTLGAMLAQGSCEFTNLANPAIVTDETINPITISDEVFGRDHP